MNGQQAKSQKVVTLNIKKVLTKFENTPNILGEKQVM